MTNRENLRDRYEKYWPLTAKREEHIKNMLEKALKVKVAVSYTHLDVYKRQDIYST